MFRSLQPSIPAYLLHHQLPNHPLLFLFSPAAATTLPPAGTPLGDPIEVGAAAAVLVEGHNARRVQQPLTLVASKSWVGHSGGCWGTPRAGLLVYQAACLLTSLSGY